MIINLGDSYYLECSIIDKKPSVKLKGEYYTVNYSNSDNREFSYVNVGFLSYLFLDFKSNIVVKYHDELIDEENNGVLVCFPINNRREILYIYFDLDNEEMIYKVE